MIIGFVGKMGSGKDEAYKQLAKRLNVTQRTFAKALKEMVQRAWKISDEDMKNKPPYVRSLLQIVGTELLRSQVSDRFWIDRWELEQCKADKERILSNITHVAITDVRFINEAEFVSDHGGIVIRIERPEGNTVDDSASIEQKKHASEMELESIVENYTIVNDSTPEDLGDNVVTAVTDWLAQDEVP